MPFFILIFVVVCMVRCFLRPYKKTGVSVIKEFPEVIYLTLGICMVYVWMGNISLFLLWTSKLGAVFSKALVGVCLKSYFSPRGRTESVTKIWNIL